MNELAINKKEEIIIPFDKIGDENWEKNTKSILYTWSRIWSEPMASPKKESDIHFVEKKLNISLPESMKAFYLAFGIADIGEILLPFNNFMFLKDLWEDVEAKPEFTENEEELLTELVLFGDYLGNGNMWSFHKETQEIYYFDHDTKPYVSCLFETFDEYLKACLIFAQVEFFGDNVRPADLEEWIEEKVVEMYGEDIVKKWRY